MTQLSKIIKENKENKKLEELIIKSFNLKLTADNIKKLYEIRQEYTKFQSKILQCIVEDIEEEFKELRLWSHPNESWEHILDTKNKILSPIKSALKEIKEK